ncbi:S8/S53 family peptidase [Gracilimonas mengyeensis]|uniref:Por secretion system C-terminal sorting domain-containing protein n=1 Tax=Gracilimonas mengyeensis TaxID=1302730 RepID=A0A521EST7_9BACT|nr:S8/S53 family peptidase [Gracilimonas mengyeensis]SMO87018.1 Por secretion system C-terminal sorting domain-containing protein [Gracilimonas mengyeensis]
MKNTVALILILLLSNIYVYAQDSPYYYWYKGEKQSLELKENKQFLLFEQKPNLKRLSAELNVEEKNIQPIREVELGALFRQDNTNQSDYYWTVIEGQQMADHLSVSEMIYQAPYFYTSRGTEVGLSHLFYVQLKKQDDYELLEKLAEKYQVEILGSNKYMHLWYTLACDQHSAGNALAMANAFYKSGYFRDAVPDLMEDAVQSVNDPFFDDQWNLVNTGQYSGVSGSDIQMTDAWKITKSHSNITLAVLDHGIELNHPDLPNIHPNSYDTDSGTSPSQIRGSHGTAVAGIAGADVDNNEGVAGIAPDGTLMSISNSLIGTPNSNMAKAQGINFAWKNGAHVINNSWGLSSHYSPLDVAIDSAITFGRNGLGSVVVFATGNDDIWIVDYPPYNNANVIAVGAVSMCNERKAYLNYISCDTEDEWGSNYGDGLDVMAPGVLIPTTDRQGTNGYNPNNFLHTQSGGTLLSSDLSDLDYTLFNGTSSAAPHVSGIASLILSINDNLTQEEVREIIETTAEKINDSNDTYEYDLGEGERQDLTWSYHMGYGRVNAYQTLIYTIENHGAHLGTEMSQVTLPLYDDLTLYEDATLESGSNLTIEAESGTITIAAASGTITIGGPGGASKIAGGKHSGDHGSDDGTDETKDPQKIPQQFTLSNNYPNPFNPSTVISYQLPVTSRVTLKVFDMLGREVATLVNGRVSAGQHEVQFDASSLSSGLYIYRLQAGEFIQTKKMMLIK